MSSQQNLVAFDLETTGLDPSNDRIIDFCFLTLNGELEETERFESLLNPGIPIPAETTEIHGITDQDVQKSPRFSEFADRIQQLVDHSVLIAHNSRFDIAVLHHELVRAGKPGLRATHPSIDTLEIERLVNSNTLSAAYKRYYGEPFEGAHRAAGDALATIAVLKAQMKTHKTELPESMSLLKTPELHRWAGKEHKESLDHERRFYRDSEGVIRFAFGQHRGAKAVSQPNVLKWMLRAQFPKDTKQVAQEILDSL